jgi:hypothetical protein
MIAVRDRRDAWVAEAAVLCSSNVDGAVPNRYDFAMSWRRIVTLIVLLVASLVGSSAAKPRLRVAADGFPTGRATPEGAASDLARAFMAQDAIGFRNICIRPYGGGQARAEYTQYLNGVSDHLKQNEAKWKSIARRAKETNSLTASKTVVRPSNTDCAISFALR